MHRPVALVALFLPVLLVGCDKKADPVGPSPSASVRVQATGTASASATASQSASASPSATAKAHPRRRPPQSMDKLKAEIEKMCPAKLDGPNIEMKAEIEKANQCVRRKMVAELDTVLIPLKTSQPARFKALMAEQADWNRFIDSACFIEEERMWVDFSTGARDDGTMRSLPFLGCFSSAMAERLLYARSLSSGSTAALAKQIESKQSDGAKVKAVIAEIATKSAAFAKSPPAKAPDAVSEADFPRIEKESESMQKRTVSLAKAACTGWPELAKALGGQAACETKAELYFYVQGNVPDVVP